MKTSASAYLIAIVLGSISPAINKTTVPTIVAIRIAKLWSLIKEIANPVIVAVNVTFTRLLPNKIIESKSPGSSSSFDTFNARGSSMLIK